MRSVTKISTPIIALIILTSAIYYPYEYGRWWNKFTSSESLYKPVSLKESVDFTSEGEFEFEIESLSYDYHEVGILFGEKIQPSSFSKSRTPYSFTGKVQIELLDESGVRVRSKLITEPIAYKFNDSDISFYDGLILDQFPLPINAQYGKYKLKVRVLVGDPLLFPESTGIYYSVSSLP